MPEGGSSADGQGQKPPAPFVTQRPEKVCDVFVSYASQDEAVAEAVVAALERQGFKCWIAPRDVTPGALYADEIVRSINAAKVLVLVLSESAIASPHVGKEIERASSKRRPIITLKMDAAPLTPALEYFLSESQWVELGARGTEAAFAKLVEAVRLHLGATTNSAAGGVQYWHTADLSGSTPRRKLLVVGSVALLGVALAWLVIDKFWLSARRAAVLSTAAVTATVQPSTPAPTTISEKSVAVLPFLDMSEKKDQEYFADGMTEEMIDLLAKIPALKVTARTSSFYFKGKQNTVAEVAKALGVAHILEGSVRKSGNTLRITAQLIRADDSSHVWSETYDRPLGDIFKIQDDIAGEIVKRLKASLAGDIAPMAKPAENSEAYLWYLKAIAMRHGFRSEVDAAAIVDNLQRAIKADPAYAPAWAELSRARVYQANAAYVLPTAVSREAHAAAEKALTLDPQLAAAHVAAGVVHEFIDWDLAGAERDYRRALNLAPHNPDILSFLGNVTMNLGRLDEARSFLQLATELDPLDERNYANLGDIDYLVGRFEEAERQFKASIALNPKLPDAYWGISFCLVATGNLPAALSMAQQNPEEPSRLWNLAVVYFALGRKAESDQSLAQLERKYADDWAYQIADTYAYRGDSDRAFAWLDRAYRQRDGGLVHLKIDWQMQKLRGDSRYKEFLHKLNLPE
jgi:TolB-like protein/Tfp pilus assembly protein PilF